MVIIPPINMGDLTLELLIITSFTIQFKYKSKNPLVKGKKQRSFYVDNKITPLFNTKIFVPMFTNMIDLLYL